MSSIAQANRCAARFGQLRPVPTPSRLSKPDAIRALLTLFGWYRQVLQQLPFVNLFQYCGENLSAQVESQVWCSRSILICDCYDEAFGPVIAGVLRVPFSPSLSIDSATEAVLFLAVDQMLGRSVEAQLTQLRSVSSSDLHAALSGIDRFNVGRWWDHDRSRTAPLLPGSAVMVFFSARGYEYQGRYGKFEGVDTAIGLSVLSVVLVSNEWNAIWFSDYLHIGEEVFGVDGSRTIKELENIENVYV